MLDNDQNTDNMEVTQNKSKKMLTNSVKYGFHKSESATESLREVSKSKNSSLSKTKSPIPVATSTYGFKYWVFKEFPSDFIMIEELIYLKEWFRIWWNWSKPGVISTTGHARHSILDTFGFWCDLGLIQSNLWVA